MPTFLIPIEYLMVGDLPIEANSLDEAVKIAEDLPLEAFDAQYCDSSFQVNYELALDMNDETEGMNI